MIKDRKNGEKLAGVVNKFNGRKICVVGDLMLDKFIFGDTERISPEAPVPVVNVDREISNPGGAGNVANNIVALGGSVLLAGVVGDDIAGEELLKEFRMKNINVSGIIKDPAKPTVQKVRVLARGQQVVRIDREDCAYINKHIEKQAVNFILDNASDCKALVISDYLKGFVTRSLVKKLVSIFKGQRIPIIVDTKPRHFSYFKDIDIITPNRKEAVAMAGVEELRRAGIVIQKRLKCNVLITRGHEGMTFFCGDKIEDLPPLPINAIDIAGAGDTVVAAVALAVASGATFKDAAILANYAAGIGVGKMGVAVVSSGELKECLINYA